MYSTGSPALIRTIVKVIAFVMCIQFNASVRFTRSPPRTITTTPGRNVNLRWDYDLQGATFVLYRCSVFIANRGRRTIVQETTRRRSLTPTAAFRTKVTVNSRTRLFIVKNVHFSDSGSYSCLLYYRGKKTGNKRPPVKTLRSRVTSLRVEGKPEICGRIPKSEISVQENATLSIPLMLCAIPSPALYQRWLEFSKYSILPISKLPRSTYQYVRTFRQENISRERCGKTLAFRGINNRGQTEALHIRVNVEFTPLQPQNVTVVRTELGRCLECSWLDQDRGNCQINYIADFLDSNGVIMQSVVGRNFKAKSCLLNIRAVRIRASTSHGQSVTTVDASTATSIEAAGTGESASKNNTVSMSVFSVVLVVGLICFLLLIFAVVYRRCLCKEKDSKDDPPLGQNLKNINRTFTTTSHDYRPSLPPPNNFRAKLEAKSQSVKGQQIDVNYDNSKKLENDDSYEVDTFKIANSRKDKNINNSDEDRYEHLVIKNEVTESSTDKEIPYDFQSLQTPEESMYISVVS